MCHFEMGTQPVRLQAFRYPIIICIIHIYTRTVPMFYIHRYIHTSYPLQYDFFSYLCHWWSSSPSPTLLLHAPCSQGVGFPSTKEGSSRGAGWSLNSLAKLGSIGKTMMQLWFNDGFMSFIANFMIFMIAKLFST